MRQLRYLHLYSLLSLCLALPLAWAQVPQTQLSNEAYQALLDGQAAASLAMATYSSHFIDKPLWQEALRYGVKARDLAPAHPEPYRFLAQAYSQVKLYEQAWQAYLAFETFGGTLDQAAKQDLIDLAIELGYTKYSQKQYRDAIGYYQTVVQLDPSRETAAVQLALSQLALDEVEAALEGFAGLAERYPDNPNYRAYVASIKDRLAYGKPASDAFYEGLAHYYNGDLDLAWRAFAQAARANADYREAFTWAGRVALELKQPNDAVTYWQRAADLDPSDAGAAYFLKVARNQAKWGVEAYNTFEEGINLYNEGRPAEAEPRFTKATELNSDYAEAWAWLGRVNFESSDYSEAYSAFSRAYGLEPASEAYRYFYAEAGRLAGATVSVPPTTTAEPLPTPEVSTQVPSTPPAPEPPAPPVPEEPATPEPPVIAQVPPAPAPEPTPAPEPETPPAPEPTPAPPPPPDPTPEPTPPAPAPSPAPEPNPAPSGGPALVLLDVTRTLGLSEGADSGAISFYKSASDLLKNLRSPVDYAGGTLYQRVEVLEKPGNETVQLQLCLVPNDDISVKPACSSASALSFEGEGTTESQQTISSFAQVGGVDFSRGVSNLMMIAKDSAGNPIDPAYANLTQEDLARYYPLKLRYSAVLVPAGGSFPGWP